MDAQEKAQEKVSTKQAYNGPKLTKHGHIRDITLASPIPDAFPDGGQVGGNVYAASAPYSA